ncbi:hypothetical protein [Pajaroellobacter abortibovis]|uniref:Uncharacterized protein n=1 Tax=Pajaroellobacter abortibovis TaxID=1882918 RepID=A0A1L6MWA4_9BACT|nr:hypothetical protein [Pajaroellobacter abortibovis]APR99718.1 hypothetical protein BCY86_02795 [Pajaroellobacter abortibovis]
MVSQCVTSANLQQTNIDELLLMELSASKTLQDPHAQKTVCIRLRVLVLSEIASLQSLHLVDKSNNPLTDVALSFGIGWVN